MAGRRTRGKKPRTSGATKGARTTISRLVKWTSGTTAVSRTRRAGVTGCNVARAAATHGLPATKLERRDAHGAQGSPAELHAEEVPRGVAHRGADEHRRRSPPRPRRGDRGHSARR